MKSSKKKEKLLGGPLPDNTLQPTDLDQEAEQNERSLAETRISEELAKGSTALSLDNFKL